MFRRMLPAFILGFVGFATSFGAHIVAVNLPVYAEQVGIGTAMIGLLIAAYDFAEILAKPAFGALADRQGMKKTMLAGIVVFTLSSVLYPFVSPRLLIFIRFLQGLGSRLYRLHLSGPITWTAEGAPTVSTMRSRDLGMSLVPSLAGSSSRGATSKRCSWLQPPSAYLRS
jgi:MFS family permease